MMVQKTALMTMYQNILKVEQKQNIKVKHTSYVDKLTSSPANRSTLGLITPRAEGDLSRLPVYAPKVPSRPRPSRCAPHPNPRPGPHWEGPRRPHRRRDPPQGNMRPT